MEITSSNEKTEKYHEFVFFWSHQPVDKIGNNCLSQWFPSKFTVDGIEYNCAEQFMMAEKARVFGDEETRQKILNETRPRIIKDLGRKVKNFNEATWESVHEMVVYRGNMAKFTQNETLGDYLISTAGKIIAEASPVDKIWGIGMSVNEDGVDCVTNWKGKNLLGQTLTMVRNDLMCQRGI